jgi:hypothetical protein
LIIDLAFGLRRPALNFEKDEAGWWNGGPPSDFSLMGDDASRHCDLNVLKLGEDSLLSRALHNRCA